MPRRKKQNLRNANGTGTIVFLGDNRRNPWMFRVCIGLKENSKGKAVQAFEREYFETKAEAETYQEQYVAIKKTKAAQIKAQKLLGLVSNIPQHVQNISLPNNFTPVSQVEIVKTPTFDEVYQKWYEWKAKHGGKGGRPLTDNTLKSYRTIHGNIDDILDIPISDITVLQLQDISTSYCNYSKPYVSNLKKVLYGTFEYAITKLELDIDNKCKKVDFMYGDGNARPHKEFTKDELILLWDNLWKVHGVEWVLILCYTGFRPSEAVIIPNRDIHLDEKYVIGGIKTDNGRNRTVPICDKIYPLIKRTCGNWLFELNGDKFTYQTLKDTFDRVCIQLGIQRHTPHDGRVTFASMMDRVGANEACLHQIIGHAGKNVTEQHYIKKNLKDLLLEVNKINDLDKVYKEKAED